MYVYIQQRTQHIVTRLCTWTALVMSVVYTYHQTNLLPQCHCQAMMELMRLDAPAALAVHVCEFCVASGRFPHLPRHRARRSTRIPENAGSPM